MIEKTIADTIGIFVKFSALQEHGVDKLFLLENNNVDSSQKNVVFLARGDKATAALAVAGMNRPFHLFLENPCAKKFVPAFESFQAASHTWALKVDYIDRRFHAI